ILYGEMQIRSCRPCSLACQRVRDVRTAWIVVWIGEVRAIDDAPIPSAGRRLAIDEDVFVVYREVRAYAVVCISRLPCDNAHEVRLSLSGRSVAKNLIHQTPEVV